MNKILSKILTAILGLSLIACTTTEKIVVKGLPNTKIYSPSKRMLGTIGQNGTAELELSSDIYYAFLMTKDDNSDTYIPFALDYKNKSYAGSRTAEGFAYGLLVPSAISLLAGAIVLMATGEDADDNPTAAIICGGGGAGLLVSAFTGMAASSRNSQLDHQWQYAYLYEQRSFSDFNFSRPNIQYVPVRTPQYETQITPEIEVDTYPTSYEPDKTVSSKSKTSSKSTKSFKNYAHNIEGEYVGKGTLTKDAEIVETYKDIKVILTRVSDDEVNVMVQESDGSNFFDRPMAYEITKTDDYYSLVCKGVKLATISIDSDHQMIYLHPRVEIDDSMYVLNISASLNRK